jgi:hypothetical protein
MSGNVLALQNVISNTFLVWGITALLLCPTITLGGQNPTFVANIDVREVVVGSPFEVTFTLTDAESQRFTPPSFRDFKSAGSVSESRGMTVIKGRTSLKQSWSYVLEASRAGTFSIGSAAVLVNGRTYQTAPLTVKVLSPAASSKGAVALPPGRDDAVFVVGELSTQKCYLGQQLTWRLVLYNRAAIEGADLIALPDFEGFFSREKKRFDSRTQTRTLRGKKYAVTTLHEESLFPQSVGEITIGAAQIRVGIEQPGASGFLFGPKPVTLSTQPVTLKVSALPEPVPMNFTGGVGNYTWDITADTNALSTDDALTLTVTLKGNGDSRRFAPPKIAVPATCEIFEPRILEEEEYENEIETVHTKRLEYVVLPKEPGAQELLPQLTYFDVDSNKYCTLNAAPIRFNVVAGKNYRPANARDSIPTPIITTVPVGIWEKMGNYFSAPVFWAILVLTLIAIAMYMLSKRLPNKPDEKPAKYPTDQVSSARQRLNDLTTRWQGVAPEKFYNDLLKSLQSYIAARLELSPAQLNQHVLRAKLAERNVTPIRVQAFLSILQTCEQAVFSGQSDASKMESDGRAAVVVVQELEKEML